MWTERRVMLSVVVGGGGGGVKGEGKGINLREEMMSLKNLCGIESGAGFSSLFVIVRGRGGGT